MSSSVRGEVEKEDNVLVIRRLHVNYHLKVRPEHRETADRVHGFHAQHCPLARTIQGCVEITTHLDMEESTGS